MLKISEFSKLSHLTVKALRFYEKEGILLPKRIDSTTGYRYYETDQLEHAAKIKGYRRAGLSISEIKSIESGGNLQQILNRKLQTLRKEKLGIDGCLFEIIKLLEGKAVTYQVSEKVIPETIVYSAETILKSYSDIMCWIPSLGAECQQLNPAIACTDPPYEFCEYLDGEYREGQIHVRHNEAVNAVGIGNEHIYFRLLPSCKVLSILHQGSYDSISSAYAYLMSYAEQHGYTATGFARECYIDGIWNKESVEEWLTEIQLPIEPHE